MMHSQRNVKLNQSNLNSACCESLWVTERWNHSWNHNYIRHSHCLYLLLSRTLVMSIWNVPVLVLLNVCCVRCGDSVLKIQISHTVQESNSDKEVTRHRQEHCALQRPHHVTISTKHA